MKKILAVAKNAKLQFVLFVGLGVLLIACSVQYMGYGRYSIDPLSVGLGCACIAYCWILRKKI